MDEHERDAVSLQILRKLLDEAVESSLVAAIFQEKKFREVWGKAEPVLPAKNGELTQRSAIVDKRGVDLYGQEKSLDTKYFQCTLCDRQVAGNRFAAHVSKCIVRGRRKTVNYT